MRDVTCEFACAVRMGRDNYPNRKRYSKLRNAMKNAKSDER